MTANGSPELGNAIGMLSWAHMMLEGALLFILLRLIQLSQRASPLFIVRYRLVANSPGLAESCWASLFILRRHKIDCRTGDDRLSLEAIGLLASASGSNDK